MFGVGPRALGRDAPLPLVEIELLPKCAADLTATGRGQHEELKAQPRTVRRSTGTNVAKRRRDSRVGQRPMVSSDAGHDGEGTVDCLVGDVPIDVAVHLAPLQRRPDALAGLPHHFGMSGPDRFQDSQHILPPDAIHAHVPDNRERSLLHALHPVLRRLAVAPAWKIGSVASAALRKVGIRVRRLSASGLRPLAIASRFSMARSRARAGEISAGAVREDETGCE